MVIAVENDNYYAAIEAGGTKFRVAIARGRDVVADTTIPTTVPDETIGASISFIENAGFDVAAAGIACFGPLDLDPDSPTYGSITRTPKAAWGDTPVLAPVREALGVPAAIDIDVGGAARGEMRWGAARGLRNFLYLTIGTGIGGGAVVDHTVLHGMGHPEMGHVMIDRAPGDDFPGTCPFHDICVEGMAAGPAIEQRWGSPGAELSDREEVWQLEAEYLAQALRTYTYVLAPERILLGGGVMQQDGLIEQVRERLGELLGGYATSELARGSLDDYVVAPELGQDAGLIGAIALAMEAAWPRPA
jgi:fructokinase